MSIFYRRHLVSFFSIIWLFAPGFANAQVNQRPDSNSAVAQTTLDVDAKIEELGIQLMPVGKPGAIYKRVVIVGNLAFTSGHIAIDSDGNILTGKLGESVDTNTGAKAAKRCAIAMLSSLKSELGSLNRIKKLIKTTGMVNAAPDYTGHSQVINGFSKVFQDLLGDQNGVGARSAVGMSSLPRGTIVEVEAIFELNDNE